MKRVAVYLSLLLLAGMLAGLVAGQAPAAPMELVAPALFDVGFHTTAGDFVIEVQRDWAPHAADRFYTLVRSGYYNGNAFYRVVDRFVAQWGLNPDPSVTALWVHRTLPDDPVVLSNMAGTVSFAALGRNTRTTQVFINLGNNQRLDKMGFAAFGRVVSGMNVALHLASDYGDGPPQGSGPDQARIVAQGAAYLTQNFPRLDVIYTAALVRPRGR
ncbi:MAG TPA: peptidylprolyl isomerase [Terriglobales bacterium]|nr:peptidylprolyl isomerase [Terriglobales bacterium]